jgi:hypothetical protein
LDGAGDGVGDEAGGVEDRSLDLNCIKGLGSSIVEAVGKGGVINGAGIGMRLLGLSGSKKAGEDIQLTGWYSFVDSLTKTQISSHSPFLLITLWVKYPYCLYSWSRTAMGRFSTSIMKLSAVAGHRHTKMLNTDQI